MGRKKIQIQRITDERNRQVRRPWCPQWVRQGADLCLCSLQPLREGFLEEGGSEAVMERESLPPCSS